jgi:hypothetical protein
MNGLLTEMVRLDGARGGLTDEEMEVFIRAFTLCAEDGHLPIPEAAPSR